MRWRALPLTALLLLGPSAALADAADAADGHWILDARLRSETVSQDGLPKDAEALTLRTRLGFETPAWSGFRALAEGENVTALDDRYNSTINGKTAFPIVSDPQTTQLNRLQLGWTGDEGAATIGRQRIIVGNARFIGNSGFRQTEQTFDAALARWRTTEAITLTYGYIERVHRVFTERSPQGDFRSDSHILQLDSKIPGGAVSAYGYLLDFANAAALSSQTWGLRFAGAQPLGGGLTGAYEAEYASQSDYRNSPAPFDVSYLDLGGGLKTSAGWASLGYERLSGDGRHAFQTPLATLHAFQGWADVFLTTPPNGIQDLQLQGGTTLAATAIGRPVRLQAAAHDFRAARGSARYGREFDALVATPLTKHLSAQVEAALFEGATPTFADRNKLWLTLELKY